MGVMVGLLAASLVFVGVVASRPNVVYVLSDDMRADVGAYGMPVVTPHLDALARDGLTFTQAFCQVSVCSPSRQSFMTSLRPDTHGVWNFIDANPKTVVATPGWFREHGYATFGLGKTFHEDAGAWNADRYWNTSRLPYFPYQANTCKHGAEGGGQCVVDDDAETYDYLLRVATVEALDVALAQDAPFFVMAGFRDPHAPWAAPKRMYDLYEEGAIAVARHETIPAGAPEIAWAYCLDVRLANGTSFPYGPRAPVPDWVARNQRHAYYAAVSYADEHVGAVVETLKSAKAYDDAIVVFHSDHGYHLGEHGAWEKKSNFDLVVRVPLLIKAPASFAAARGVKTGSFVELVDVFPTLAALAGLPKPPAVDGDDVSAVFGDPSTALKTVAYAQYPACGVAAFNDTRKECNEVPRADFDFMGYSIRTPDWRLTLWLRWNGTALAAHWDGPAAVELYNHTGDDGSDMDAFENENLADAIPGVAAGLRARLAAFFKKPH